MEAQEKNRQSLNAAFAPAQRFQLQWAEMAEMKERLRCGGRLSAA
jgi:hypothetical protein